MNQDQTDVQARPNRFVCCDGRFLLADRGAVPGGQAGVARAAAIGTAGEPDGYGVNECGAETEKARRYMRGDRRRPLPIPDWSVKRPRAHGPIDFAALERLARVLGRVSYAGEVLPILEPL